MNPIGINGKTIEIRFLEKHKSEVMQAIENVRNVYPKVLLFEPYDVLCPKSEFSAFDGEHPIFFDGDHLSNYGARKCVPLFNAILKEVWIDRK